MAGSSELLKRSLALQEHSLRVLPQILPQVFRPGWLRDSFLENEEAKVRSIADVTAETGNAGESLPSFGFSALRGSKVPPLVLPQVRCFTGFAATRPAPQKVAYASEDSNDAFDNGSFGVHSREDSREDTSASDGSSGRHQASPSQELGRGDSRTGPAGNGAERRRVWRRHDNVSSPQPSSSASEGSQSSSREDSHSFASPSGSGENPRMTKTEMRKGKVHWVEIDEHDALKARDFYGASLDPRLDAYLETSRGELEAYRLRELAGRRAANIAATPILAESRWPERFQLAALNVGKGHSNPWNPEAPPPLRGGDSKLQNGPPAAAFRTASQMEGHLGRLLQAGQYDEVQKEFSAYKGWCQAEFGRVSDRVTGKMYTSVLLAFLHSQADSNRCRRVHEEMRSHGIVPSCLHYNTLLKIAMQEQSPSAQFAIDLVNEMQELGVTPDQDTYNTAALVCAWGKYSMSAHRYVNEMLTKGMMPPTRTLKEVLISLIRTLGEGAKRTEEAGSLLKVMLAQDIAIQTFMLQEVLTACVDQDDDKTASLCLSVLEKRSHTLDEGTLTAALHTAARRGSVDLLQLAWAGLLKSVGTPSPAAHLARLQALTVTVPAQGGIPLERLFEELAQLEETLGPRLAEMDPEEADILFDPAKSYRWLVARLSRRLKALDKAYYVLTEMYEAGQRVPLLGLNCIIQGCANVRDMSRAFETFDEIQRTFNLEPDVHSFNALLDGCGQARQIAATVRTFELMEASGVAPNKRSWELLVSAHVINRSPAKALVTLQDMVNKGFVPDKAVLDGLLRRSRREEYEVGITTVGKLMEALGFQEDMKAVDRRNRIGEAMSGY